MKIGIESEALDSLKAMTQKLQDERDELLNCLNKMCAWHELQATWDKGDNGYYAAKSIINKCTAKPGVLE